jgi:hypothetical protein
VYEVVTGRLRFQGVTDFPIELEPAIGLELNFVILKALEKENRFQNAAEFPHALEMIMTQRRPCRDRLQSFPRAVMTIEGHAGSMRRWALAAGARVIFPAVTVAYISGIQRVPLANRNCTAAGYGDAARPAPPRRRGLSGAGGPTGDR